jgi:hypothetical protein
MTWRESLFYSCLYAYVSFGFGFFLKEIRNAHFS